MPIIIDSIIQGSEEWKKEKLGKPSASNASKIVQNDGKRSKQREGYLYELVAESITGRKEEAYQNINMQNGIEREDESRKLYEIINDVTVKQVGLIYKDENKDFLCSPDGLINNEYGLELKNVLPKTQVKYLLDGKLPSEYFSQIQFSLFITDFKYWDFLSYSAGLNPLIIRVKRDEAFIETLRVELNSFIIEFKETIKKIGEQK